jgi:RecB family exonuclease
VLPSRILFHGADDEVLQHVRHFLPGDERERRAPEGRGAIQRELPRSEEIELPGVLPVTAFRTYLESPYAFYLRHVLKLETLDDSAREMDPLRFGLLAHDVLEAFGREEALREATDPRLIQEYLKDCLSRLARERYGRRPLPAVTLQLEQLDFRLARFADEQGKRVQDGWRIEHVEWKPEGGTVELDVDGEPILLKGRIDRIDRHVNGGWAIWDYKTGEEVKSPEAAHRTRGEWRDLQLPLYALLCSELGWTDEPEIGYVAIPKKVEEVGFKPARKWDSELLAEAWEVAREVVRRIRRGELWDLGRWNPREEIWKAIGGQSLIATSTGESEDES